MQVNSGARRGSQGGTGIPDRSVAREDMPGKSFHECNVRAGIRANLV